jgi:hypothetical protein
MERPKPLDFGVGRLLLGRIHQVGLKHVRHPFVNVQFSLAACDFDCLIQAHGIAQEQLLCAHLNEDWGKTFLEIAKDGRDVGVLPISGIGVGFETG